MAIAQVGYASREGPIVAAKKKVVPLVRTNAAQVMRNTVGLPTFQIPTTPASSVPAAPAAPAPGGVPPPPPASPFDAHAYDLAIRADPAFGLAEEAYTTGKNTWGAQYRNQIANSLVQGGWDLGSQIANDPTLAPFADALTPDVSAQINANQLSTRAQLAKQLDITRRTNAYEQAARGTLGSGSQAAADINATDANVLATNTAQNQLLDALRGGATSYADRVAGGLTNLNQTYADVANRLSQNTDQLPFDTGAGAAAAPPAAAAASPAAKPPPSAPFGGVVSTRKLPNGSVLVTYASGRQVQQVPGKPAYVVKA